MPPTGSVTSSAKLLVPCGASDQLSAGETLSPVQAGLFLLLPANDFDKKALSVKSCDCSVKSGAAAKLAAGSAASRKALANLITSVSVQVAGT